MGNFILRKGGRKMEKQNSFFYTELSGTPYEIGKGHGAEAKKYILRSIETYQDMFREVSHVEWEDAKKSAAPVSRRPHFGSHQSHDQLEAETQVYGHNFQSGYQYIYPPRACQ
jgi:hypothetical protein